MMKFKLGTVIVLIIIVFTTLLSFKNIDNDKNVEVINKIDNEYKDVELTKGAPPSIQLYYYIKKYAKEFDIPESYAFSLAYQETTYRGPLHLYYNHRQVSYAGALGPMQIMPGTAKWMMGKTISNDKLKNDIDLNVYISMKLLRHLHDTYNNWGLAFGAYNTGRPMINQYAKNILNKQYDWIDKI